MSAIEEAIARLESGYYNSDSVTTANPGGMGDGGHVENFPKALKDTGDVVRTSTNAAAASMQFRDQAEAHKNGAQQALAQLGSEVTQANAARDKAQQWADRAEDNPVETAPNRFSARHWALKAAAIVNDIPFLNLKGLSAAVAGRFPRTAANGAMEALTGAQAIDAMLGFSAIANRTEIAAIMANLPATDQSLALASICDLTISQLKSTGLWALHNGLWTLWAPHETLARVNLKTGVLATNVNAATHVPLRGFLFNGANQSLDTNFAPATQGAGIYQQNSAHLSTWIAGDNGQSSSNGFGSVGRAAGGTGSDGTFWIRAWNGATSAVTRLNSTAASSFTLPSASGVGHLVVTRPNSTEVTGYKDGSLLSTQSAGSAAVLEGAFFIGRGPADFSAALHGGATIGAHLTAAQITAQLNILTANRRAYGAY